MAIASTTARADIFKEFYNTIKDNITTPSVKVTNAFVHDVTVLPQVVIHAPSLPKERSQFGTSSVAYNRDGDIEVEVYAATMQSLVELVDDVENSVFANLGDFSVTDIMLGDSNDGTFELQAKSVRVMILPFSFKFKK